MADFCTACSAEFGAPEGWSDLKGATSEEAFAKGLAAVELCEGCGAIQVNPAGECISTNCSKEGQPGHGVPAPTMRTEEDAHG